MTGEETHMVALALLARDIQVFSLKNDVGWKSEDIALLALDLDEQGWMILPPMRAGYVEGLGSDE